MEERLVRDKATGLNTTGLRIWGMVFLVLAAAGKALLQNRLLDMNGTTDLITALNSQGGMIIATVALMLQAVEGCAIPVFAFLAVEGVLHTSDFIKYLLRVCGLALLTELPYNFAMSGKLIDLSDRNPVFAVALALILIYFFKRFEGKGLAKGAIKVLLTVAAFFWATMLRIQHGAAFAVLVAVLWTFRKKPNVRNLMGGCAMMMCSLISPFYLAAPMGFLILHFYNGEKGPSKQEVHYLVYPAALLAIGLIGYFVL